MILVVGVNGTGKTTTIGKLAWHLRNELGRTVVIGAADTFRAAAVEQLERWGERAGVDVVKGPEGSDPGAVAFDAIARGRERGADVVIIDTAGRLHTQTNLMEELAKVRRVITKQMPDAPHETLMTVDATTGQNGVRQAKLFGEAVGVTGIILTKLDGTAKGGIALAIANELGIPVKLIGIGEQLEDLRPFDAGRLRPGAADRVTHADTIGTGHGSLGALADRAVVLAVGEIVTLGFFLAPFAAGAAVAAMLSASARGRGRVRRLPGRLDRPAGRAAAARPLAPARAGAMQDGHGGAGRPDRDGRGAHRQRRGRRLREARRRGLDRPRVRRGRVIEPGTRVHVLEIRGATALVSE